MKFKFKQENNLDKRKKIFNDLLQQYPDKIPIICEKYLKSNINNLDKTRYLVPKYFTVLNFMAIIGKRIQLNEIESFFLFTKNGKYTLKPDEKLNDIYERYKDKDDGFLYFIYASEEIWG